MIRSSRGAVDLAELRELEGAAVRGGPVLRQGWHSKAGSMGFKPANQCRGPTGTPNLSEPLAKWSAVNIAYLS